MRTSGGLRAGGLRWFVALVLGLAVAASACGTDDSGNTEESGADGEDVVEGTTDDPRLESVCASRPLLDDIDALFTEQPGEPEVLEGALEAIAATIADLRAEAPATMHEGLDALAQWWEQYTQVWARYENDVDQAEAAPTDPFALVLGPGAENVRFAGTWVAMADNLCVDDYDAWCEEEDLTEARCRCVEEAFVTAAVESGLPTDPAGSLDLAPLTEDCPDSYGDRLAGWCDAFDTVTTIQDFVLQDRSDRTDMAEQIVTGEFTSEEDDLVDLVEAAQAYVDASPPGVAPLSEDLAAWVRDYDELWADYDYAYARILDDAVAVDRLLAANDDGRFADTIPALIALDDTLCEGRDAFVAGCTLEGGDDARCSCVWSETAQAVLDDGVPISADGTIDVEPMTADCNGP